MRRLRSLLVIAAIVAAISPEASALPPETNGCTTVQGGALGNVVLRNCRYIAAGPGAYTAVNVSNWKIAVSRDGGASFKTIIASGERVVGAPASYGGGSIFAPGTGTIPTEPGDIVDVAIYPEALIVPAPAPAPRVFVSMPYAGFIEAHDA